MAKIKFDGVVEAVHYASDGVVDWVRVYERRGPTFSDRVMLNRETLVGRLQAGKKFMVGNRVAYLSSTFDVTQPVRLVEGDGKAYIVTGEAPAANGDNLEGVPVV